MTNGRGGQRFRHSDLFRHSSFVIRHSYGGERNASPLRNKKAAANHSISRGNIKPLSDCDGGSRCEKNADRAVLGTGL